MIEIRILPILDDNYAYLIHSEDGTTAIVDPGEAAPVIQAIEERGLSLDYIINTHHHWDHVNGNPKLKEKYNAQIVAPARDAGRIKGGVDIALNDGDHFDLGTDRAEIIATPGHTLDGVCYYFKESKALFTGDTLFSMGCGRLFEGTPADMFQSFQKLQALPNEAQVYCGHEYTRANAGFCLTQDKHNEALKSRITEVKALREQGKPTIPTTLGLEKKTNVFMKAKSAEEFAALRQKKDNF